jgi:hypothetical protein
MKKKFRPILILFVIINTLAIVFAKKLQAKGVHNEVIIFIATFASGWLYMRAVETQNAQAIMRGVYGGFMIKFFLLLAASIAYIALVKPINKPAFFFCMGLYLVYHFLSINTVLTQKKTTKDGEGKTSV